MVDGGHFLLNTGWEGSQGQHAYNWGPQMVLGVRGLHSDGGAGHKLS